jgi:hypothetical protein
MTDQPTHPPDPHPADSAPPSPQRWPRRVANWFRHAFSTVDDGPAEPTPEEAAVVDRVLSAVVERGLTTPALLMIESVRPLNYVGAQAMRFFQPLAEVVLPAAGYQLFTGFLERRSSIDYLSRRLQELDEARRSRKPRP